MASLVKMISKLNKNNKGLSLVELIVSFAILGILMIAIVGLMSTGMTFFSRSSTNISLQYEYQIVMTQLREYIVDANAGIVYDDAQNALYAVDVTEDSSGDLEFITHVFFFDAVDSTLYYLRTAPEINAPPALTAADFGAAGGRSEVSTRMNNFYVDIEITPFGRAAVSADMGFFNRNRQYRATQEIAMRNLVETATDYDELCDIIIDSLTP